MEFAPGAFLPRLVQMWGIILLRTWIAVCFRGTIRRSRHPFPVPCVFVANHRSFFDPPFVGMWQPLPLLLFRALEPVAGAVHQGPCSRSCTASRSGPRAPGRLLDARGDRAPAPGHQRAGLPRGHAHQERPPGPDARGAGAVRAPRRASRWSRSTSIIPRRCGRGARSCRAHGAPGWRSASWPSAPAARPAGRRACRTPG